MSDYLKYTFLYEFAVGGNLWRYTSNAEDVIDIDGQVWEACAISDSGVSQSGETTADTFSVTAPFNLPPARLFAYSAPSVPMDFRMLVAEFAPKPEAPVLSGVVSTADARQIPVINRRVQYVGEIVQCGAPTPGTAVFTVETLSASMRQEGLRGGWQRQCPHALYDPLTCKVDKSAFAYPANVLSVTGFSVSMLGSSGVFPTNLTGGLLSYTHPIKGAQLLMIEAQAAQDLIIFGNATDLWPGMPVVLYPGCDQTPARCKSFGNYLNYGGYEAMPGKSPFDGVDSPVF